MNYIHTKIKRIPWKHEWKVFAFFSWLHKIYFYSLICLFGGCESICNFAHETRLTKYARAVFALFFSVTHFEANETAALLVPHCLGFQFRDVLSTFAAHCKPFGAIDLDVAANQTNITLNVSLVLVALVISHLRAAPTFFAMLIRWLNACIAGTTVDVCVAIFRWTRLTCRTMSIFCSHPSLTLPTIAIALTARQFDGIQWYVCEHSHRRPLLSAILARVVCVVVRVVDFVVDHFHFGHRCLHVRSHEIWKYVKDR